MFKRIISVLLSVVTLVLLSSPVFAANSADKPTMEDILREYHTRSQAELTLSTGVSTNSRSSQVEQIKQETVTTLIDAGYEAYDVNAATFSSIEENLNTDFSDINLDPNGSYIVVVSGEDPDAVSGTQAQGRSTIGSSFNFTYNGVTYTMRYVAVTAGDDPHYGKSDDYDCLNSKSSTIIQNCLNTAIYTYADAVSGPFYLGTVASICGLQLIDFSTSKNSTLTLNAGANWTRIFTQVWDEYSSSWYFCSSVEYANRISFMSGLYYNSNTNSYQPVPTDTSTSTVFSEHCYDMTWRKEHAVTGYIVQYVQYDIVGDITFRYNQSDVITLREDF